MSTTTQVSIHPPIRSLEALPIDQRRGEYGMWCLIATEAMLFVCMFGSYYYLGTNKDRWAIDMPPSLKYPFILLAILVSSSVVLEWGKSRVLLERFSQARIALWVTVLMGLVFLMLQAFEYVEHWKTLTPYSDSYGSIFYTITTLHALHVIVGLLMLSYVGVMPRYGDSRGSPHRPYQTVSLYWHFVDFVWLWIVLLLYVVPRFQGTFMVTNISVHAETVPPKRLWFGLAGTAVAWLTLGFLDCVIVWMTCAYEYTGASGAPHAGSRILSFIVGVAFFATALTAGFLSYHNWQRLSQRKHILNALATDRREFMALLGVIISITLGLGIVWLSIPPLLIEACQRAK